MTVNSSALQAVERCNPSTSCYGFCRSIAIIASGDGRQKVKGQGMCVCVCLPCSFPAAQGSRSSSLGQRDYPLGSHFARQLPPYRKLPYVVANVCVCVCVLGVRVCVLCVHVLRACVCSRVRVLCVCVLMCECVCVRTACAHVCVCVCV